LDTSPDEGYDRRGRPRGPFPVRPIALLKQVKQTGVLSPVAFDLKSGGPRAAAATFTDEWRQNSRLGAGSDFK